MGDPSGIASAITGFIPVCDHYIYRPVKKHVDFVLFWKKSRKALEDQIDRLIREREAVQDMVLEAESYFREANENVKDWLGKVERWIRKENGDEDDETKSRLNVMTRYQLGKSAADDAFKVEELIKEASKYKTIWEVSKLRPPAAAQQVVLSNYETISSRNQIVDKLVEALKSPGINKVGVYGMGGIGKTVLANEVRNRVLEAKLFDEVVMCPLPREPSIREIQRMILDALRLKAGGQTESVVATRMLDDLKKKKYLVILDNLWKPLDLRVVGIPIRDQDKGCKILLTSRDLNILSENGMGCQKNIQIPSLSQEEAEDLFKLIAGYSSADGNALDSTAREIVQDCAGLPVSIVAAAKGLKKRPLHVWQSVRRKMIGNTMKQEEHSSLEMSYELLESKELQSAFVLCSEMANNCSIRDFLKFAIPLDVFDEFLSVEEAQDEARSLVLKLREASLLLGNGSIEEIVMHDVVRDVGQSIASKDYQAYARSHEAELRRWPRDDRKRICLYCHIVNLPKELNYPELEFLVIDGKDRHLKVSADFKLETEKLKVLALYRCSFSSLPSFKRPKSLATLCLDGSGLLEGANIDTIGQLENLEILSFVESDIGRLTEKLGELSKLRILDLSDCSKLDVIPPNVISRLTSLEELYMGNSFSKWKKKEGGSAASHAESKKEKEESPPSLAELKKLKKLTNLEIHIPDEGMMPENLFNDKLERYSVTIGSEWGWGRSYEGIRRLLKLKLGTSILKESYGVRTLVRRAEVLHLEELGGVENNLYQLDGEGFPELKHLNVSSNSKIKYIVNARKSYSSSFPQLESLILKKLVSLEKICDGNLRARSLCNLKDLQVEGCSALKNLFSITTAQKLFNLERIKAKECKILEEIVAQEGDQSKQDKPAYENFFSELRWLDLHDLPKLRNFYPEGMKQSKEPRSANKQMIPVALFNEKIVFSKLEGLTLNSASNIERLWHGDPKAIVSSFKNLTTLTVEKCHKLKYLFTSSMVSSLEQLQYLSVRECNGMEEIIVEEKRSRDGMKEIIVEEERPGDAMKEITVKEERSGEGEHKEMKLLKLSTLLLENLQNLKRFSTVGPIKFPALKRLDIKSCEKLETFISKSRIAGQEESGHEEDSVDTRSPKPSSDQQRVNPQSQKRSLLKFSLLKCCHTRARPALKKLATLKSKRHSEGCGFKPLFDKKVLFPRLEEMNLFYMNNREIWHKQFPDRSFCDLKKLTVKYCSNLQRVFPSNTVERFKRLDNLEITDCNSLVEIFELPDKNKLQEKIKEGNKEEQFQLRRISLQNLGELKSIWKKDPMGVIILKNLQSIEAVNCPDLKHIFPFSIANKLEKLEELKITNCEWMEHVIGRKESEKNPKEVDGKVSKEAGRKVAKEGDGNFANKENEEVAQDFWFPNLTFLTLSNLRNLSRFYTGNYTLDCPALKIVELKDCPSLKVKELKDCGVENFSDLEDSIMGSKLHSEIQELQFSGEKAMNDSKFGNKETHVSTCEFPVEMASTVKTVKVEELKIESDVFPLNFLQKFLNLEKLVVTNSSFKVLFSYEGMLGEQGIGKHLRMRNLEISSVQDLLHIWEEDYRLDPFLQHLETLDVQHCHSMRELLPLSGSFQNLTILQVNSCDSLRVIMTSSTARSLVQLKWLNVQNCCSVKEIVADLEGEMNDAIIFSRLEHLGIVGLPNLVSFAMESCTFIFPSMKEVIVGGCPKMEFFSRGLLSTPKLDCVRFLGDSEDKLLCTGDLNDAIQGSFRELDSSAQDSHATLNNKVTEASDAESDDVPLVRKTKGKEDSTLPKREAEMVHQAPSGEIEVEEEVV